MIFRSKNKFFNRLYTLSQAILDCLVMYAILCAVLYCYYLLGADYSMRICLKLILLPILIVFINIMSRVYGRNLFYPGLGINRVEDLKRSTLSIVAGYITLFAYLGLTHSAEGFSRLALGISMAASVLLVPITRNIFKYICRILLTEGPQNQSSGFNHSGRSIPSASGHTAPGV